MARPHRLDDDQRLLWKAYRDVYQGLFATLTDQLQRDAGLSGPEYAVLVAMPYAPEGVLSGRELCAALRWRRSPLSHLVGRMVKRGLVTRAQCPQDLLDT